MCHPDTSSPRAINVYKDLPAGHQCDSRPCLKLAHFSWVLKRKIYRATSSLSLKLSHSIILFCVVVCLCVCVCTWGVDAYTRQENDSASAWLPMTTYYFSLFSCFSQSFRLFLRPPSPLPVPPFSLPPSFSLFLKYIFGCPTFCLIFFFLLLSRFV